MKILVCFSILLTALSLYVMESMRSLILSGRERERENMDQMQAMNTAFSNILLTQIKKFTMIYIYTGDICETLENKNYYGIGADLRDNVSCA